MSTSPSAIPKVRTYAADLNSMRGAQKNQPRTDAPVTPIITEAKNEQVVPPFHTFSKSDTSATTATVAKATPAPDTTTSVIKNAQTETQRILTATSSKQASGELRDSMPAVIITDTKHKRFRLSSAISNSLQDWWGNKKESAKQKKIPKYTVPVAERRKGVIQKATAKTGRESSADHSAVLTRIKATKQIPPIATILPTVIPKPLSVPAAQWDSQEPVQPNPVSGIQNQRIVKRHPVITPPVPQRATESPVTPSWETDIQSKVNALVEPQKAKPSPIIITGQEFTKIKQQRSADTQAAATIGSGANPVAAVTPAIKPVIPPAAPKVTPKIEAVTPAVAIRPNIPTPPPAPAENVVPRVAVQIPPQETVAIPPTPIERPKIAPVVPTPLTASAPTMSVTAPIVEPDQVAEAPAQPVREERRFAPPRETKRNIWSVLSRTNHIVFITMAVLIFVVGSGLGIRAYRSAPQETTTPVMPIAETEFSGSTMFTETNYITTASQLGERLKSQSTDADSLVEITFLNSLGNPLLASDFITLFDATVPFDFVSSLNGVTFGNYRGAPWVLFTISDKTTALGGMLAWENNMGSNLAPIFSTGPTLSYSRFTDSIINGVDVRIMKNDTGTEEIVYGFVGYDKLLITSNTTAFLNLAQKIY